MDGGDRGLIEGASASKDYTLNKVGIDALSCVLAAV